MVSIAQQVPSGDVVAGQVRIFCSLAKVPGPAPGGGLLAPGGDVVDVAHQLVDGGAQDGCLSQALVGWVKLVFGFQVGGMGQLGGGEISKVALSTINLNAPLPPPIPLVIRDPEKARCVLTRQFTVVVGVFLIRSVAQVDPAIIGTIPIDVIDLIGRPFTSHPEKSKAVGKVQLVTHAYLHISLVVVSTGDSTGCHVATAIAPSECTGVRVVVEQCPEFGLRQHYAPTNAA